MTFYGPQSCSLGGQGHSNDFPWASKLQFASLQRIQTSKIPNTFPNKHRPQQAPQIHSNDFLWASKLPFASLQRIQTSKIPNTFPNMHPRAKATSPTGTPGPGHSNGFLRLSKLPFARPQTLQNSPKLSKPSKRSKPS